MPYILIFLGIAIADLAWKGPDNLTGAGALLKDEMFGGSDPFYKWFGAIILLGMLGYLPAGRAASTALLVLVLLAIILSRKNFNSFTELLKRV